MTAFLGGESCILKCDTFWKQIEHQRIRVPREDQDALKAHAKKIRDARREVRRATAQAIIKVGGELAEAQRRLANHGDGTFAKWCYDQCGIGKSTAYRAIAAHRLFKDRPTVGQSFECSALYLISAESAPAAAVAEAIAIAGSGKTVTTTKARQIIAKHAAKPKPGIEHSPQPGTFIRACPVQPVDPEMVLEEVVNRAVETLQPYQQGRLADRRVEYADQLLDAPHASAAVGGDCPRGGAHRWVKDDDGACCDQCGEPAPATSTPAKQRTAPKPKTPPEDADGRWTLCDALTELAKSVYRCADHWPTAESHVLSKQLRVLADDLERQPG